jgi:ABC-2 type transport system permease protein
LAPPFKAAEAERMGEFVAKLKAWPPAGAETPGQSVRNLLSVAAVADISADLREAEIARAVFDELQSRFGRDPLRRMLAWTILRPEEGTVINELPEFGLKRHPSDRMVRERSALYAKKFLGRLLGKIPELQPAK